MVRIGVVQLGLDGGFHRVRQLVAAAGKELDAVVIERIVRGGDDDPGLQAQRAREIGHGRRRHRPASIHVDTRGRKPGFQRRFQHVAGDARVLADQHRRTLALGRFARLRQHLARGITQPHHEFRRDGMLAHRPRTPSVPKYFLLILIPRLLQFQISVHRPSRARHARARCAPRCTASKAAATLAAMRSPNSRPVIVPSMDLRDKPASTGTPRARKICQVAQQCEIMLQRLAKTKARVDHDAVARNARRFGSRDAVAQKRAHFGDDILVMRLLLHGLRLALLVHQAHRRIARGNRGQRAFRLQAH